MSLVDQLVLHEGLKLKPYLCTANKLTIGIGRNLEDKGISKEEAFTLLWNDIRECQADLSIVFPNFYLFSGNRQYALIDMRFNLGPTRFRSFKKMIKAILNEDWEEASRQAQDSLWARQVQKSRVELIISQLSNG